MREFETFVTHLECSATGAHYPADEPRGLSEAGKPLLVRYDLESLRRSVKRETFAARDGGFWKYREFLPVRKSADVVRLGEEMTPLVELSASAANAGAKQVLVKDEGRLPTGSFKARGLALAVAMAKAFGLKRLAMPTNGNAGAALAAYAARAGIETPCLLPGGHAGNQRARDRARRRARDARRRPDQRLRQARRGRTRAHGLVRRLDAQGAVSHRGQEDDGLRAGRAARLDAARRHLLPDRRRHGPHRHVEGVRRTRGHRLDRARAAADGRRAGDGLRADRAGVAGRRASTRPSGRTRKRTRRASACRRRSATS